jgi:hypothetical protein
VLQWSRAYRFRLVLSVACIAIAVAGWIGSTPLSAQEQSAEAVLLSGPIPVKGIPVYTPNRIPALRGIYALEGVQLEEAPILTILFTRHDLLIPREWSSRRCGAWRLYQIPDSERFSLCYRDERGFLLFFLYPQLEEPAYWCGFVDPFIERLLFLFNFVESESDVPFPAILQIE